MLCKRIALYEGRDDVTLTTYVLDDSPEMLRGGKRGAVLVCPGGAYLGCSDREGEPVAMAFAAMGYHAFVLRYSVYSEGGKDPLVPGKPISIKPQCQFPAPILDIARAMLYIGDHAQAWFVDMEKVAICGFSAGAHNCAMYSVYWNKALVTQAVGADAERLRPAACILGYMVSDYQLIHSQMGGDPMADGLRTAMFTTYLGTPTPDEETLAQISPALLVDKDVPPAFLWATCEDGLVPVQHSTLMATALARHGVPFEMHVFEKGSHGLGLATQASAGNQGQVNPAAARWLPLCGIWLNSRFALDLPAGKSAW